MLKHLGHGLAVLCLVGLVATGLGGCWNPFAPDEGDGGGDGDAEYKIRTSPSNVLHNLMTAYENKNAEEYLDCLAEDFIFFLNEDDWTNDPTLPQYWGKAEEQAIHENMFAEGGDVDRITLTLTLDGTPVQVPGPEPEDPPHWQYQESVDLRVYIGATIYLATAPSLYEFRIDEDPVGPSGETLWEIWRWYDLDDQSRLGEPEPGTEHASFGLIKADFLK